MKKKNKKQLRIVLIYYLPLIVWMGLIFYLSSLPGLGTTYPPDAWFYVTRKGAHLAEYFVLTILVIRILNFCKVKSKDFYWAAITLPLAYAFSDEIHQLFVFGREGKFLDVGIDFVGIALGLIAWKFMPDAVRNKRK